MEMCSLLNKKSETKLSVDETYTSRTTTKLNS